VRSIKAEQAMMEICKNAASAKKGAIVEFTETLKQTSLASAEHHSPYAAESLKQQSMGGAQAMPNPPVSDSEKKPVKIEIQSVSKYPSK
jgi:hypothetical protein